jgi:RNA polymerase-binding protein DksA
VKAPAVKAPAKKTPAKKTPTARRPTAKAPPRTSTPAATEKGTRKTKNVVDKATAQDLAVKPDEDPWTTEELAEVRGELHADRERLRRQLNLAEHELQDLMRDAGDGAGHDQADVGSTTFERDQEMSLAKNAREMLAQTERALLRIEDGSYGRCESCGQPIGKMRVMAFPRATLCLSCKQREERR